MAREDALESLITQNFARTRHAGAILKSIEVITRHLPIYRLSYHNAEVAAEYLSNHSDLKSLPAARFAELPQDDRQAPLSQADQPAPEFAAELQYIQAANVTETPAGDDSFLADGTGLAIFRLNPVSAAIWRLLEEPTDLTEVASILAAAFPDVAADQIAMDSEQLMRGLAEACLIMPVAAKVAAQ
nr:PqqD family protein [Aliiroseovarius subalbicans]